jgi:hypothetical protein
VEAATHPSNDIDIRCTRIRHPRHSQSAALKPAVAVMLASQRRSAALQILLSLVLQTSVVNALPFDPANAIANCSKVRGAISASPTERKKPGVWRALPDEEKSNLVECIVRCRVQGAAA